MSGSDRNGTASRGRLQLEGDKLIRELHARLARGEFKGLGPVTFRDGSTLPDAELVVRIMLADWSHYDDLPPEQRDDLFVRARRLALLEDLRALVVTLDRRRGRAST